MILDKLTNYKKYVLINSRFEKAFEYLIQTDFEKISPGEYVIDGREVYAVIVHSKNTVDKRYKLEVHRKYIDIQFTYKGSFDIGWKSIIDCKKPFTEFDEIKDYQLFSDEYEFKTVLSEGSFAIYFPEDAHAPISPDSDLIKVIIKILL
jgi:biofilm protein TabA